jgi:outer membrane murein-binding lipoprotein Lpp
MSACARTLYRRLELAATTARLREQNADLRFISSQQTARVDQLTSENTSLRARLNDALMQNGIVLPSGHEVRWHGHKEHMKAHSPLAPAAEAEPAAKVAPGTPSAPMAGGLTTTERATMVRQLRAAARQASNLQFRLEDAEARAARLEMESKALREAAVGRDAELERLQRAAAEVREGAQLSAVHVNEEKNLTIAQLNHQVDFLNSQCATLESELAEARRQAEAAAETEARVDRLMGAVRELRDDKEALQGELLACQKLNDELRALGLEETARTGGGLSTRAGLAGAGASKASSEGASFEASHHHLQIDIAGTGLFLQPRG